jgi:hypothetical protein
MRVRSSEFICLFFCYHSSHQQPSAAIAAIAAMAITAAVAIMAYFGLTRIDSQINGLTGPDLAVGCAHSSVTATSRYLGYGAGGVSASSASIADQLPRFSFAIGRMPDAGFRPQQIFFRWKYEGNVAIPAWCVSTSFVR